MTAAPSLPQRIVLTGPTGWIGRAMLQCIARACAPGGLAARVTVFGSSAQLLELPDGQLLPVRSLADISPVDVAGAHVVHLAYLTKEKAETLGERAFTSTNLLIDDQMLTALAGASASGSPALGVFVASSGAAALAASGRDMHPYGIAKLRQEARFLAWGKSADIPVLAGRIFNIAGPWMNKLGAYALSDFILQALDAGRIAIGASIPVFRSYLHVEDLCHLALGALDTGIGRYGPVDLCGAEVVEMEDLAAQVGEIVGRMAGKTVTISRSPLNPIDLRQGANSSYLGEFSSTKSLAMALDMALQPLARQIEATCEWILATHRRQAVVA